MANQHLASQLIAADEQAELGQVPEGEHIEREREIEATLSPTSKGKGKERRGLRGDVYRDDLEYEEGGDELGRLMKHENASRSRRSLTLSKEEENLHSRHAASAGLPPEAEYELDEDVEFGDLSGELRNRRRGSSDRRVRGGFWDGPDDGDGLGLSKAERTRNYWKEAAFNVVFILAWYTFSTLISVYNKWMFSPEHYDFAFPLFVTSVHMLAQFLLAGLTLSLVPSLRPDNKPQSREYITKAVPCGMATGLDIGLSNLSLKTITLSFYTMCKSSSLAFVLLFAFIFRLEKPSLRLISIIGLITLGVILMVSTETQFHFVGMVEVLTASSLGGLRWSLTQILLDKKSMGMNNPIATLFWLAPIMGTTLAVCSMLFEGWGQVLGQERFFGDFGRAMRTLGLIVLPGVLAFCMNVSEFGLIQRTSVVTLSVAGIFKEVATIFVGTVVFGDELTPINISGLVVAIFGIALYNYFKFREFTKAENGGPGTGEGHGMMKLGGARTTGGFRDRPSGDGGAYSMVDGPQHVIGDSDEEGEELGEAVPSSQSSVMGGKKRFQTEAERLRFEKVEREARELQRKLKGEPELVRLEKEELEFVKSLDEVVGKKDPVNKAGGGGMAKVKGDLSPDADWELA